ncbi:MAG TPA: hypothetical protein EYP59_22425, partial [Thiotrichaceae bacterium]|nr:hypothetical protein [Thiotrichaceae bacterium]
DKDGVSNIYHSLSTHENAEHFKSDFSCKEHGGHLASLGKVDYSKSHSLMQSAQHELAQLPVQDLITYRLALAGTAEYTASQGGTKALAYASMVTTINRVNEILQRDTGVKLELVTGEQLLYLDAAADPYTNSNLNAL